MAERFALVTLAGPGYLVLMSYIDPTHMRPLGAHLVRVDGDSVFMVSRGPLKLADLKELHEMFVNIRREQGALFVFYDSRGNKGFDPDARKEAMVERREVQPDLQVSFGAPFAMRVLLDLLFTAYKLMKKDAPPFYTFPDEAQAQAFFDTERDRIRRKLALAKAKAVSNA